MKMFKTHTNALLKILIVQKVQVETVFVKLAAIMCDSRKSTVNITPAIAFHLENRAIDNQFDPIHRARTVTHRVRVIHYENYIDSRKRCCSWLSDGKLYPGSGGGGIWYEGKLRQCKALN